MLEKAAEPPVPHDTVQPVKDPEGAPSPPLPEATQPSPDFCSSSLRFSLAELSPGESHGHNRVTPGNRPDSKRKRGSEEGRKEVGM